MQFIQSILAEKKDDWKNRDASSIPEDTYKEISKNVKKGAEDQEMEWANAMELVNRAYDVSGVERPAPSDKGGWEQYEALLQVAVTSLFDTRGTADSSRFTSKVFREHFHLDEDMERMCKFRVYETGESSGKGHTVEAKNMEAVIEMIRKQAGEAQYDMDMQQSGDGSCTCKFSYQGIERPYQVTVVRL